MKLSEVCTYVSEKVDCSSLSRHNYISTENMLPNVGGVKIAASIPSGKATSYERGDILFSNIRPYFKKLWRAEYSGGCSADVLCIRAKENIDKSYLYYLLTQDTFISYVMKGSKGCKMPRGDKEYNMDFEITLPPLSCQRRISSLLSSLDDKIGVNRAICRNLEEQAQALFKEWFVDFAPFKGRPFVDTELGRIPEGWKVGTLGELCGFISRGLSPKYDKSSDEIVLGQTCVRNNIVTLNNSRRHVIKTTQSSKKVKQWDVLINSTGIGSLGRVGVVYFDMDNVAFDSHLTVVRSKEEVYRHYIGRNLLSRQREIENMAVGSTGQTELPKKDVLTMKIIVPPADVLLQTNSLFENYANMMYRLIEESSRLSRLRDTMLPRLMSGELAVPCGAWVQADAERR